MQVLQGLEDLGITGEIGLVNRQEVEEDLGITGEIGLVNRQEVEEVISE